MGENKDLFNLVCVILTLIWSEKIHKQKLTCAPTSTFKNYQRCMLRNRPTLEKRTVRTNPLNPPINRTFLPMMGGRKHLTAAACEGHTTSQPLGLFLPANMKAVIAAIFKLVNCVYGSSSDASGIKDVDTFRKPLLLPRSAPPPPTPLQLTVTVLTLPPRLANAESFTAV